MHIDVLAVFLTIVFSCLAWWVVHQFNIPPILMRIVEIIIVVVAVFSLLAACGIVTGFAITAS